MPVNWGIIGLGNHVDHFFAPAIAHAANSRLVAVCSRDMLKAKRFADKHSLTHAYDSFTEMLGNPDVDVVYIATPNSMHAAQAVQAAGAKKHVCCEKPMALNEAEAERMIEACRENGVRLGVVFQNRYHPAHIKARQLIRDGEAGEIVLVRAQYCRGFMRMSANSWRSDIAKAGAGALVGAGVHPIDLLRYLLGSEPEEVRALCEPQDAVDNMDYMVFKFKNGVRAVVVSGIQAPRSDNDVVVYGTALKITCRGTVGMMARGELLLEGDSVNVCEDTTSGEPETANFTRLIEDFSRCVIENREPGISGHNGLQMVRVVEAVLKSSREGRAVAVGAVEKK